MTRLYPASNWEQPEMPPIEIGDQLRGQIASVFGRPPARYECAHLVERLELSRRCPDIDAHAASMKNACEGFGRLGRQMDRCMKDVQAICGTREQVGEAVLQAPLLYNHGEMDELEQLLNAIAAAWGYLARTLREMPKSHRDRSRDHLRNLIHYLAFESIANGDSMKIPMSGNDYDALAPFLDFVELGRKIILIGPAIRERGPLPQLILLVLGEVKGTEHDPLLLGMKEGMRRSFTCTQDGPDA